MPESGMEVGVGGVRGCHGERGGWWKEAANEGENNWN